VRIKGDPPHSNGLSSTRSGRISILASAMRPSANAAPVLLRDAAHHQSPSWQETRDHNGQPVRIVLMAVDRGAREAVWLELEAAELP
jgi:NRPS condensation-like uncharacterized protein